VAADKIRPDSTFASLGADDLDFVEIVMATEDAHKVSIPDDLLIKVAGITAADEIVHHLTIAGFSQALDAAESFTETEADENLVTGRYSELVTQTVPEGYSFLFVPSLAATLKNAEDKKGLALSEAEVLIIRDQAPAMVVPHDVILKMNKRRKNEDIDPGSVWSEWQKIRTQLN